MADPTNIIGKIRNELLLLNAREKATRKGQQVAKVKAVSRTPRKGFDIEVMSTNPIEGGVEVFARAWHPNGKQVGFGVDGSVEVERFRIFNPPILVPDEAGDIVKEWQETELDGTVTSKQARFREDAEEALLRTIEHNLAVMRNIHSDDFIVRGKIGRTTSTFYPNANAESTSVDGHVGYGVGGLSFATVRGAATGNDASDSGTTMRVGADHGGSNEPYIYRGFLLFDTSALGDGDTISSATLSVYAEGTFDSENDARSYICVITTNPASNTALTTADYDAITHTKQSDTNADITSISTAAYTDFALNSTGLGNISKTGITKLGLTGGHDFENTDMASNTANKSARVSWYSADQTGTTNDPKLVVEHSSSTPVTVTPAAQVATFSIPAYSVLYDKVVAVGTQVITASIPAYTVSLPKIVLPSAQVATFSIPAYSAGGFKIVAVNVSTATFSIPAPSILRDFVLAIASAVTATFSTPAPTVSGGTGKTVLASALTGTFTIPAYTVVVVANRIVSPSAAVATFSIPTLAKVGAIWRKIARSTNDTWSRTSRNST